MKRFLIALMMVSAGWLHAASMKSGKERLRELVVIPAMDMHFGYFAYAHRADFLEDHLVPGEIEHLRQEVKEHPEEPEDLLRLGMLLYRNGETNEAQGCFERGEKAAQKKSELRSTDGLTLVLRADALAALGRNSEVESLLRRATLVSSNEWKCWAGLGRYLGENALNGVLPTDVKGISASEEAVLSAAANYQPPSELLAKAEAMRKESEACYDRAVALAPKEPDVYLDRANIEGSYAMIDFLGRFYRDRQPPKPREIPELRCSAATVRDLKEAARWCPDDDQVVMAATWLEAFRAVLEIGQRDASYDLSSWKSLPENARDSLREAMGHLEELSRVANKSRSAGAFQSLGILKMMTQDWAGAIGDFHRALALEPIREKAWEGLLGAQVGSGASPEELVMTCKGLVKNKDCCRSRLFLAKALIKQNKFDDAKLEIKRSADLEPNNILSYFFAGAVLLKLNDDENNLSNAVIQMTSAKEVLDKMPDDSERLARWREFMLNGAILSGLLDKPAEAKDWLRQVLKYFPEDQAAKDILSAIP